MHGMTEEPEILCDDCNNQMKRIITGGAGVHYKGNGWPRKGSGTVSNPRRVTTHVLAGPRQTPDPEKTLRPFMKKGRKK